MSLLAARKNVRVFSGRRTARVHVLLCPPVVVDAVRVCFSVVQSRLINESFQSMTKEEAKQ